MSLDLVGLPPSIEEVNAFVNDPDPEAYVKLVDRLLASPQYGERWALWWLDVARYADSNGYESDRTRSIWPWRDWVVRTLNDDMPFDQFVIEQIAGDMLPDAGVSQRIATGFHRNTWINEEGGQFPPFEVDTVWEVVRPVCTDSTAGSTLTIEKDLSLVASGESPSKDTYIVVADLPIRKIEFVRLEVLPGNNSEEGLIGRAENGDFVITDFSIRLASRDNHSPQRKALNSWTARTLVSAIENRDKLQCAVFVCLSVFQITTSQTSANLNHVSSI